MRRITVLNSVCVALLLGLVLTPALAQPGDQDKPKQEAAKKAEKLELPICPVMDKPIDFGISVMTDDGPVYFCCKACPKKYEADPKKYAEKVAAQRKALAAMPKVQVTCPLSGKPIDKKAFIEKDGKKIYFCCKDCPAAYEKEPAKYAAKLAGSYTYQTKCPVSGEEINPSAFISLEGGAKVYFCCKDCIAKFEKDAAKYAPKLKEQGIGIDPAKIKPGGEEKASKGQEDKPKAPAKE